MPADIDTLLSLAREVGAQIGQKESANGAEPYLFITAAQLAKLEQRIRQDERERAASLPRELMESCEAASEDATMEGFAATQFASRIDRFTRTVYRMGFESGWRIREQQISAAIRSSGTSQSSPLLGGGNG